MPKNLARAPTTLAGRVPAERAAGAAAIRASATRVTAPGPTARCVITRLMTGSSGHAAGHGHDHRDVDHRFGMLGQGLVVAHAAAALADPGPRRLDHPAAGNDSKAEVVPSSVELRWRPVVRQAA